MKQQEPFSGEGPEVDASDDVEWVDADSVTWEKDDSSAD